jgi:hypothetical protein
VGGRERSYQGQEVSLDRQALLGVVHHVHELTDHRQVKDDVDPRYHLEALDYVRDERLPKALAGLERLLGPGKSARDRPRSRGKFIAAIRRKNGEVKSLIFQISFRNSKQSARHISSSCERAKCLRKFFVDKAGNVTCYPFNYRSQ